MLELGASSCVGIGVRLRVDGERKEVGLVTSSWNHVNRQTCSHNISLDLDSAISSYTQRLSLDIFIEFISLLQYRDVLILASLCNC